MPSFLSKALLLPAFMILSSVLTAQVYYVGDSIQYFWGHVQYHHFVPEGFENEDAVIIEQSHTTRYFINYYHNYGVDLIWAGSGNYHKGLVLTRKWNILATDLIEMKVKLLTRLGLQEFSKIFIPELPGQNILFVAARAIKKDGTVIEMDMDDMEKMDFSLSNANDKEKVGEVRFSIPNTAVDDVVEIVYMVKRPYFNTSETAMLASYLPAMKSTFNLAVSKGTRVDYRQYNGVYPPALIDEGGFKVFSWKAVNQPGMVGQLQSNPFRERACVTYVIRDVEYFDNRLNSHTGKLVPDRWETLFREYGKELTATFRSGKKSNKLYKFIDKTLKGHEDMPNMEKLLMTHHELLEHLEITIIDEDMFWDRYTPGFYVDKGQIPVMEVPFLNKVVLSNFGYEGYLAYARSNFETPLDTGFVLPPSAENLFLVFYDEDSEPHFIFPSTPAAIYEVDEIPVFYQGVKALVYRPDQEDTITEITVPEYRLEENYSLRKGKLAFDLERDTIFYVVDSESSGVNCSLGKGWIRNTLELGDYAGLEKNLAKGDHAFFMDTAYICHFDYHRPIREVLHYEGRQQSMLSHLDSNIYALPLTGWFYHRKYELADYRRTMDFYFPGPYGDHFDYTLEFGRPVELLNGEELSFRLENDLGTYELSITQDSDSSLHLVSSLSIFKKRLPGEEFHQLVELEKGIERAGNGTVMVGM